MENNKTFFVVKDSFFQCHAAESLDEAVALAAPDRAADLRMAWRTSAPDAGLARLMPRYGSVEAVGADELKAAIAKYFIGGRG